MFPCVNLWKSKSIMPNPLSTYPTLYLIVLYLFHVWVVACGMENDSSASLSDAITTKGLDIAHNDAEAIEPKCFKFLCSFTCINGKQDEIAYDIALADASVSFPCSTIKDLHIINYEFDNAIIPVGFLSTYINKIESINLGISNVVEIENGAFGGGIFKSIYLYNLRVEKLSKNFFENISKELESFYIKQQSVSMLSVHHDFLDYVKFQLKCLTMQMHIDCVRNVTELGPILGAVVDVDLSYNDFQDQLAWSTFTKLTMVERLVLASSNIYFLPNYIFQGMKYLSYLDISHNKLKTISMMIFGTGSMDISSYLTIDATDNNWHCDCELHTQMKEIFKYQKAQLDMFCVTPDEYRTWMVFDERLCGTETSRPPLPPIFIPTETTKSISTTTGYAISTTSMFTTTARTTRATTPTTVVTLPTIQAIEIVSLECSSAISKLLNDKKQNIQWPQLYFSAKNNEALMIKVTVEASDSSSTFGLIWFPGTTNKYYLMELSTDEYSVGCYFTMPYKTIVKDLMPNVAYTFCLVNDQQHTVSPFSCKSVHISGNLETSHDATYSKSMRAKGISLMVLGVVVFMILGILVMFMVLRRKPIWLKGSKRIVKPKYSSGEVVVLPRTKTAKYLRQNEKLISQNKQRPILRRSNSTMSFDSTESYINPNFYEIIPAYLTFDKIPQTEPTSQPEYDIYESCELRRSLAERESVRYAQIKPRTKRVSSDPLPAIPSDS